MERLFWFFYQTLFLEGLYYNIINFVKSKSNMSTAEIKEYLHRQIEVLDDRFLKAIYAMLQSYSKENTDQKLTSGQKKELERRKLKHLSGESKSYTWQEVKDRLQQ